MTPTRTPATTRRRLARGIVEAALLGLFVYVAFFAWSMAERPQLYAPRWYARGGHYRTAQILATDVLGPRGVLVAAVGLAILYVLVRARSLRAALPIFAIGLLASRPMSTSIASSSSSSSASPNRSLSRPNVLLLSVASLRADRIAPTLTPTLSALAARGARFDRAFVSRPSTRASWISTLTGLHPHHHGTKSALSDALPKRFARAGYATRILSDDANAALGGVDLGFERAGSLDDDLDAALSASRHDGTPLFLTVALSTTRAPYSAPAPYYAKYTDPGYRGPHKYEKAAGRDAHAANEADLRQLAALYDGAVAAVDDAVARVLQSVERAGLAGDTIVVVTADRGEILDDRAADGPIGDERTHVPLLVYDPRVAASGRTFAGLREGRIVRDVDVAPTLYELAGVAPPPELDGNSFAPALRAEPIEARYAYAEAETSEASDAPASRVLRQRMIRDERWKLVYAPARTGVKYMLFDTSTDPGESHDVAAEQTAEVMRLRDELWAWMLADRTMESNDGFLVPRRSSEIAYDVLWIDAEKIGLAPTPPFDALARRGVRFTEAYASHTSPRLDTMAMLSGARVSELGSERSSLPLALARRGVATHTSESASEASAWIRTRAAARSPFFLFAKLDGADHVAELLDALDAAHVRERTIVVITFARDATTARAPMVIAAPGLLPEGREVNARVSHTDLAPTIADLVGIEPHARASGKSLLRLARGEVELDERPVVIEGPETRTLMHDRYRLVVRSIGAARLFDVVDDPHGRHDLSAQKPDLVAEMRARLEAAVRNVRVAGSATPPETPAMDRHVIHVRFAGASRHRRVSGTIVVGDADIEARSFSVEPVDLGHDAFTVSADKIDVALVTRPDAAVGFDIVVDPPATPVTWTLYLDDAPWPEDAVFGGPFGLRAPGLRDGIVSDEDRLVARAPRSATLPEVDPRRDLGVFVVRR